MDSIFYIGYLLILYFILWDFVIYLLTDNLPFFLIPAIYLICSFNFLFRLFKIGIIFFKLLQIL